MCKVVVLSKCSLLSEGIVCELQRHRDQFDVRVLDAISPDALEQVLAINPLAVIIEESEMGAEQFALIFQLLCLLPTLKVLRLNQVSAQIQVIQWKQQSVSRIDDLIGLIGCDRESDQDDPSSGNQLPAPESGQPSAAPFQKMMRGSVNVSDCHSL